MARMVMSSGRERWWPDRYNVKKRELLDPSKTANDNIWDFVYKVTCIWLNKARVFALTQEDMEELEQDVRLATYLRLRYIVATKQYNKKYSFWVNCTRSCFAVCHHCIKRWMDKLKVRKDFICGDDSIPNTDDVTFFDCISFNPMLITSSENPCKQKLDYTQYTRPYDRCKRLQEQINDAYMEYCEECLELCVEPIDKESFIRDNFSKEEQDMLRKPLEAISPNAIYLRNWIARKKAEDPDWWRRRMEKQKEYAKKHKKKKKKLKEAK